MHPIRYSKFKASALILALFTISACSSSPVEEGKSALPPEAASSDGTTPATTDAVPASPENPSLAQQPAPGSLDASQTPPAEMPAPVVADATVTSPVIENPPVLESKPASQDTAVTETTQEGLHYKVKHGDTLMKIAFENYGDLYRWKEIYEANRSKIQDPNAVPPGTELVLSGAGQVSIDRNGDQYLIKHGDTLSLISTGLYGTSKKWKRLWENNRQLVKDPNKIYAGFYLFYQSEGLLTRQKEAPAAITSASAAVAAPVAPPVSTQGPTGVLAPPAPDTRTPASK